MFAIANLVCEFIRYARFRYTDTVTKTLKRRLPPKHITGGIVDLRVLKSTSFSMYCLCTFFTYLGLYTGMLITCDTEVGNLNYFCFLVLTFIELSGVSIGLSPDFASYLIRQVPSIILFIGCILTTVIVQYCQRCLDSGPICIRCACRSLGTR
jgi:hypothetical protein